jgi:hypothetical protein
MTIEPGSATPDLAIALAAQVQSPSAPASYSLRTTCCCLLSQARSFRPARKPPGELRASMAEAMLQATLQAMLQTIGG